MINKEKTGAALKRLWPVLALLLYIGLNVVLILHHENWRDEAQAWQIAKQLGLRELFGQLRYEGHPCLWYLILMPFAKLGFPFGFMNYISLFFMAAAAWLFLKKAPFAWPVKLILLYSPIFTYYYPVISRSYALIPLLLFGLAALYPERMEKPLGYGALLALLTQTHVFVAGPVLVLSAVWLLEVLNGWRKKNFSGKALGRQAGGLGLSLCSGLFLVAELLGSVDQNAGVEVKLASTLYSNLLRIDTGAHWATNELTGIGSSDQLWRIILIGIVIGMVLLVYFSWKEGLIFAVLAVLNALMYTYIYLASVQKVLLVAFELIFALWIIFQKKPEARRQKLCWQTGLAALALLSAFGHEAAIRGDMEQPYSASRSLADYIEREVPEDAVLVCAGDLEAYGAAAYLPERVIWYPVTQKGVTYAVWNEERKQTIDCAEMFRRVREQFPDAEGMYLICCVQEQDNVTDLADYMSGWTELYRVGEAIVPSESAVLFYVEF